MRLHTKYGIIQSIEKVDYKNSGNVYKENLTLAEIETRIDSILDSFFAGCRKYDIYELAKKYITHIVLSITRNPVRNIHLSFSYGQILANLSFSNGQFQGDLRTCTGSKRSKRSSVMLCSRWPPPTSRGAMQGYECCNRCILCAV